MVETQVEGKEGEVEISTPQMSDAEMQKRNEDFSYNSIKASNNVMSYISESKNPTVMNVIEYIGLVCVYGAREMSKGAKNGKGERVSVRDLIKDTYKYTNDLLDSLIEGNPALADDYWEKASAETPAEE